jgi:hypothetical protein
MLSYEDRQKGLGQDYFERVSETIESIARDPRRCPVYEGKRLSRVFRRAALDRFPYIVVFQFRTDETLVVAVAHSSQQPGYWEGRETA